MNLVKQLSKMSVAVLLATVSTYAVADTADAKVGIPPTLSCPTENTLNNFLAQQGSIPSSFSDQGFTWTLTASGQTSNGKVSSFMFVSIPTKVTHSNRIMCGYLFSPNYDPKNPLPPFSFYEMANVPDYYKGVTGNWDIRPDKSECDSNSATGCLFTHDN